MSGLYQVREKLKGRNIVKEITNSVSFYLPTNFKKNKEKKITSSDIYPTHSCNTCCYGDTRLDGCWERNIRAVAEMLEEFCQE